MVTSALHWTAWFAAEKYKFAVAVSVAMSALEANGSNEAVSACRCFITAKDFLIGRLAKCKPFLMVIRQLFQLPAITCCLNVSMLADLMIIMVIFKCYSQESS